MVGRSHIVHLTLVGIAGLLLAGRLAPSAPQMRYNTYRSREDCERDYTPAQCAPQASSGSYSSYGGGYWHGPSYYADRSRAEARSDPGAGRFGLRAGVVSASVRGGFGAFGRAAHAIG